jgi:hypothetical protein
MSTHMKLPQCDREQEVLDAIRSARWASVWGEEIQQHVAACAVCAEVALVAQEFQREEGLARTELQQMGARLPSAGFIWWKAQLAARHAAQQRAAEPMVWAERAACVLGALAALGSGIREWPRIVGWIQRVRAQAPMPLFAPSPEYSASGSWLQSFAHAWPGQTPIFLLTASAAAFLTLVAFAAYVVWREE